MGMTYAIEVDGLCIGQCALFGVNWVARTAELGITIGDKKYWGQGHGRESVNLLVHYAFHHQTPKFTQNLAEGTREQ
jgi:RimJ/RimL family protein N-acetyltransferase